jgi:uncharacterized protein YndB with AHSA1/START domain
MATESIHVTALIPASPKAVYDAWLSSEEHALMTGGVDALVEPHIGGSHSAWGDYIQGKTLALEPGKRIVQSWRTVEFPEGSGDSQITVTLAAEGGHTRIAIAHVEIPAGQGASYESGWHEHYFAPMIAYFARQGANKPDKAKAAKKGVVKKTVAKKAAVKKAAAKKTVAKKPAVKKAVAKKTIVKKTAKKMAAKKTAAKKTARKAAAR